jgi:argininosuccinate lyase
VTPSSLPNAFSHSLFSNSFSNSCSGPLLRSSQVPFRETHHVSGRAVALAESLKCSIADLSLDQYLSLHPKFEQDVFADVFDFEQSVEKRNAIGGPSKEMVGRQVKVLRKVIQEN